jgi:hypothetical protein
MGSSVLDDYDPRGFYCEMPRSPASRAIRERLAGLSIEALKQRAANANAELYNLGITLTVYSDAKTIDRILPFDVIPRVLSSEEWHQLCRARRERGSRPRPDIAAGSGSCRDFAVLMREAVRSLGLAAHFVSGYLYVPEDRRGGRVGGGATHAWLRVYLPGAGWVEFDPTNGIVGNHDLIRVAVVRDPRQAVPVSGTWTGFPSDALGMTVEVEVTVEAPHRRLARHTARERAETEPHAAGA